MEMEVGDHVLIVCQNGLEAKLTSGVYDVFTTDLFLR